MPIVKLTQPELARLSKSLGENVFSFLAINCPFQKIFFGFSASALHNSLNCFIDPFTKESEKDIASTPVSSETLCIISANCPPSTNLNLGHKLATSQNVQFLTHPLEPDKTIESYVCRSR